MAVRMNFRCYHGISYTGCIAKKGYTLTSDSSTQERIMLQRFWVRENRRAEERGYILCRNENLVCMTPFSQLLPFYESL